jgi:hypothetical protein
MADHILVVFSNPAPGQEREFNDWYNRKHISDVLNTPGVVSGRRFMRSTATADDSADAAGTNGGQEAQSPPSSPDIGQRYMAVWELEGELGDVMANITRALEEGLMDISPALTDLSGWTFTAITPRVTLDGLEEFQARLGAPVST